MTYISWFLDHKYGRQRDTIPCREWSKHTLLHNSPCFTAQGCTPRANTNQLAAAALFSWAGKHIQQHITLAYKIRLWDAWSIIKTSLDKTHQNEMAASGLWLSSNSWVSLIKLAAKPAIPWALHTLSQTTQSPHWLGPNCASSILDLQML